MKKFDQQSIKKIGIFDSGIGGLSMLKIFQNHHAQEIVYYADTAFMPYGNKSPEEIQQRSLLIADYLISQGADCILIACHTASAYATEILQKKYPKIPRIGLIDHVVQSAAKITINKKIGILATVATIASKRYEHELKKINSTLIVFPKACPDLATLIEHSALTMQDTEKMIAAAQSYLEPLFKEHIDTLILGCTHYSLIKDLIKKICEFKITVLSAEEIIQELFPTNASTKPFFYFYTTGDIQEFNKKCSAILGWQPVTLHHEQTQQLFKNDVNV